MFNFHKRKFLDVYDLGMALKELNQWEAELLLQLEIQQGPELTKIQQNLNRIAFQLAKIKQYEKEFDNNV